MSRKPNIIHGSTGYRLDDEQMALWQNVEHVMLTVSKAAGSGQLVSLDHREPESPSKYGYTRGHATPKYAQRCASKSLNAFQRLLGYCAYSMAGYLSTEPLGPDFAFYSDRQISHFYQKLDPKNPDVHILAKLLFSSLWKMRRSHNHTGVVVAYEDDYDYAAVGRMLGQNVPVYVAWPGPGINPYMRFRRHHLLKDFIPQPEHLKALESPPTLQPAAVSSRPAVNYGVPPTAKVTRTYDHPLDYVTERLEKIKGQLEQSPDKQRMLDRLASASKRPSLGKAAFFRFDSITVVDEQTGQKKVCWTRNSLSKSEAREYFDDDHRSNLWYALLIPPTPPPLMSFQV